VVKQKDGQNRNNACWTSRWHWSTFMQHVHCPSVLTALRKREAIIRFCCDTICMRSPLKYRMFNGLSVESESFPPKTSVTLSKRLTYTFNMSSFSYIYNNADAYMMLSQPWAMYPEGPEGYPSVDVVGKSDKCCGVRIQRLR